MHHRLALLLCFFLWFPSFAVLRAQEGSAARQAAAAALEIYRSGNYRAAAEAYAKVVADYPTSDIIQSAQVQLASSYFLSGQPAQALQVLDQLAKGPAMPPELQQIAAILRPQALSAEAAALKADDSRRAELLKAAIAGFGEYLSKFPSAADAEQAVFGRALAAFQSGQFDAAAKDLEANLQRFPNSPSALDSQNLLALTLATQGSRLLAGDQPTDADRAAARQLYARAIKLLTDITAKKSDLTLVNAAYFQLGEILLNEAAFAPEKERPALLARAREAFRSVLPRERIVALQQRKVEGIPALRRAALAANNQAELRRLDRQMERDTRKLAELQSRPDQTTLALQKIGEAYFSEGQYDEARVLLRRAAPGLTEAEDKKRNLYFTTMSYALQNAIEPAVAGYDKFQGQHRGDPLAANLPLTLGAMFLNHPDPARRDPERAARYFKEAAEIYPQSPLLGLSVVNEATARARQGDFAGALRTYEDFLKTNPPAATAAVAQLGIGNVLKDQGKADEAVAAFRKLVEAYPETPQAEEAELMAGVVLQQKGDNAGALQALEAFRQKRPGSALTPNALFVMASAKLATGDQAGGLQLLEQIAKEFPQSQPAPFTYFQRAQIVAAQQKPDEVVALMKAFLEQYPQDEKVFFAFDSIGQTETNRGNIAAAVSAYSGFVEKYPQDPKAPDALLKIAELQRLEAERLGRYTALTPAEQEQWKASIAASLATGQKLLEQYPDSPAVALALRALLAAQRQQLDADLLDEPGVEAYFTKLAEGSASESAKSKVLFALAAFVGAKDSARALKQMGEAYNPSLVYAPGDLDLYGAALLEAGRADEAGAVYEKLAADYPLPDGVAPGQASPQVQEAQATALFGLGAVAQAKGDVARGGELFGRLKAEYPWSPKVLEANYGIAKALKEQGQAAEALALLTQIIRAPTASSPLRADAMLLGGFIQKDQGDREAAIDYFLKIAAFYEGVPQAASTGLWEGSQLLEEQVRQLQGSDPQKAARQKQQLVRAYTDLVKRFPDSPHTSAARERLTALGAPVP